MSFAVVRGSPTRAQLHLDELLKSACDKYLCEQSKLNLSQVLFHCMEREPAKLCMIDAVAEKSFSNAEMLSKIVAVARGFMARGLTGQRVMMVLDNHYQLFTLYYASMFSGVIPFFSEPSSSTYELLHFIQTMIPSVIFCDNERLDDVKQAVQEFSEKHTGHQSPEIVVADDDASLDNFFGPQNNVYKDFVSVDVSPDSPILMLPTSGTTGLPKMTVLKHEGVMAQLSTLWSHSKNMPQPSRLIMLVSTEHWITHTMVMTGSAAFGVGVLYSRKRTPQDIYNAIGKYKPDNMLCSPPFALKVANIASKEQLSSLKCTILGGSTITPTIYSTYKIVSDNGEEVGVNDNGELHLRSKFCIFKNYYNNDKATRECFTSDGWFNTGDIFVRDEEGLMYYVERRKFIFKYMNHQISPEEAEAILCEVPGVLECAVCGSESHDGAAAALVLTKADQRPTKEQLHQAINSKFSHYKRLHGGIAFVDSLPHSKNGKLDRKECAKILNELVRTGQCC